MTYWDAVTRFNEMYRLRAPDTVVIATNERIGNFVSILSEEVTEAGDIVSLTNEEDRAVSMSDWLGDIIVYCSTFAREQGLPMAEILGIIMESNFSKLGADGQPIYDERGKVMKGPGYWKPEPMIRTLLENKAAGIRSGRDL